MKIVDGSLGYELHQQRRTSCPPCAKFLKNGERILLRFGSIIAWLALIFGAFRLGAGLFVASIDDVEARAGWAARYLGSASSGEAIDQGVLVIVFGVVLGILVKIGRSVIR